MLSQLLGALVLVIAVLGMGLGAVALLRKRLSLDPWTSAGLIPLSGVFIVGVVTLVAGHLFLLHVALPLVLAAVGALLPVLVRSDVKGLTSELALEAVRAWRAYPLLVIILIAVVTIALLAGLAPPVRTDEIEYHWPAPVAWAERGGWNASPFRHVNAFPLMEIVYTPAALMGSPIGAHWTHTLTMVGLGLCTAGIAVSLGSRLAVPVAAATVVSPVVYLQSMAAYNDVGAAAFTVAAVAVVLSGRYTRWALVISCLMLVAAISSKPTSVVAVGCVALIIVLAAWWRVGPASLSVDRALRMWIPLAVTGLATLAFWTVRQYLYTGNWLDPAMTATPDAYAQTMLPDAGDRIVWPLIPFVSGIIGGGEPWGGRTSLVLQAGILPALVYVIWRRGEVLRRFALVAIPAYLHWIILGAAIVRTRFHILSWALLIIAVALAAEDFVKDRPQWKRALRVAWLVLIVLGVLDFSRQTVDLLRMIRS